MTLTCEVDGCGAVLANRETLAQQHKTKHLGFWYYCGGCAYPPFLADHRKAHEGCRRPSGLELQPQRGFYCNGRPVAVAQLSHALLRIHFDARGEPLGELGGVVLNEPRRLGEAVAEQQQAPQGAEGVDDSESEQEGEMEGVPFELPCGFYCTICPLVAPLRYVEFDSALDLGDHIAREHCDNPLELPPYDRFELPTVDEDDGGEDSGDGDPMCSNFDDTHRIIYIHYTYIFAS